MDPEVVPNITGVIDLLGFASYLDLGQNDIRTNAGKAGKLAIDRTYRLHKENSIDVSY